MVSTIDENGRRPEKVTMLFWLAF